MKYVMLWLRIFYGAHLLRRTQSPIGAAVE
jgi:hypothetical protein